MINNSILTLQNIYKDFPGIRAVDNVSLNFNAGETHCIVGENGAGKSTLVKILSGAVSKDSGEIIFDGRKIEKLNPIFCREIGIGTIYQEGSLIENLNIIENIFLGNNKKNKFNIINNKEEGKITKSYFEKMGLSLETDFNVKIGDISPAMRQMVELIKILLLQVKVIIFDEPTSSLDLKDVIRLLETIEKLKKENKAIIFISHKIEEVQKIADKISIMRDGHLIGTYDNNLTKKEIISFMSGKGIGVHENIQKEESESKSTILSIKNLNYGNFIRDINFDLKQGEVLGITGLVGSGKSEIAEIIFGFRKPTTCDIYINGKKRIIDNPIKAIRNGIGLVTEDRKLKGLVLEMLLNENLSLASLDLFSRFGIVQNVKEIEACKSIASQLNIKYTSMFNKVSSLSGGNQQKVMLAKWLLRNPLILVMDEPTRGVDVATKFEIYELIKGIIKTGVSILIFSSEIEEIIEISDRILVLKEGLLVKEFIGKGVTRYNILETALLE